MSSCLVSKGFSCFKLDIGISTHLEFLPVLGLPAFRVRKETIFYIFQIEIGDLDKILFDGCIFRA